MAVAKALGARSVLAIDLNEERLDFAKDYAATSIYLSTLTDFTHQSKCIRERFEIDDNGPSGIDLVLECTGAESCLQTGLLLLKQRGTLVQVRILH